MCPVSVGTSQSARALQSGEAKLWVLLVGVNHYNDAQFPRLAYPALDCQGLGEAIADATQTFPNKAMFLHHDFASVGGGQVSTMRSLSEQIANRKQLGLEAIARLRGLPALPPTHTHVLASLEHLVTQASPQDTVLVYFSGHGLLDPATNQAVLCLSDTQKDALRPTGLEVQQLLQQLSQCAARQQLVWLDACHSGGLSFRVGKGEAPERLSNPTPQLMDLLRQRAAQSKGFYALLSCDVEQQSWEFPELGHGVFTYFLMRGLRGEAADAQGVIEADALYKYVYYQTLQYIDKTNQQLRLINQQKRGRGDSQLQSEYPLQTPKRIVEGVGELILGIRLGQADPQPVRRALVVDGLGSSQTSINLSKRLQSAGGFELSFFPQAGKDWSGVRTAIQTCLQGGAESAGGAATATVLLYLRGHLEQAETGDALLTLKAGVQISRSWLRQALRRSPIAQQVVVLDCPEATALAEWIEDLQIDPDRGQCLIAAASPASDPELVTRTLLDTLTPVDLQSGLSAAGWIAHLQASLAGVGVNPYLWLSGSQGVIEILPGQSVERRDGSGLFDLGFCPYMGLRAFGEDDAAFFFGRDSLIQRVLSALALQPFLAVVGASGSGKSSVMHAGVVEHLRQGKQIPGSDTWWIRSLRPGARPLEALAQRLVDEGTDRERSLQQQQIEGLLHLGPEGFVQWLRSRPEPMVVLIVDQFEELFTLASADERQRFLDRLLGGVHHAGDRFKLVLTLRTDFVAPSLDYPELASWLQRSSVLVPPHLTEADYRQIIVRPAEKVGLKVDPELVEVLLQELSHGAGDLPLLEFVLEQVWEHRLPGKLTLSIYQQKIGGLKGALERKAQAVYDSLDREAQACARWIFLSLTQLGDGTEDTRRRISKTDLIVKKYPAELVERTLQALVSAKLVVIMSNDYVDTGEQPVPQHRGQSSDAADQGSENALDARQDVPYKNQDARDPQETTTSTLLAGVSPLEITVEVAHEILIRHWSTLRWWLDENRTRLRTRRQIEQSAHQWHQSGRQADFLLRGVRLDAAEELYVKYTDELSREVQEFVEACIDARDREQQQTQQRLRRAYLAIALMGMLGLAAVGLGSMAYWQQRQAQLNELRSLNALSEAHWLGDRQLEALTTALQAGRLLARTHAQGDLRMQTIATLQQAVEQTQEVNRLQAHQGTIWDVAIRPDGAQWASASDDGTLRLWSQEGRLTHALTGSGAPVTTVAYSPDGQWLASGAADGVRLWQPETGTLVATLPMQGWVTHMSWSADGQRLAIARRDQPVTLWAVSSQQQVRSFQVPGGWVTAVQVSPDGTTLATGGDDATIRLWTVATGQLVKTLTGHTDRVTDLAFSPDGKLLFSTSDDATLRRWEVASGTSQIFSATAADPTSHGDRVTALSLSTTGSVVVSASADGTLRRWTLAGVLLNTLRGHRSEVTSVAVTPDGTQVVSGGVDQSLRLWQMPPPVPPLSTDRAVFSPNGRAIATAGWDGDITLWSATNALTPSQTLTGHTAPVHTLAFSPEGTWLLSAGDDLTVKQWHLATGNLAHTLTGHTAKINQVSVSAAGDRAASASDDHTVRLWNLTNGTLVTTLTGHTDGVSAVAYSPRGDRLASGSYDQTIRLWTADGQLVRSLTHPGMAIAALAFSPDGTLLASGSWDHIIRLWRVADGALVHTLTGHQDGVRSLSFSPNGTLLASASMDHTLKLWFIPNGTLIKTLFSTPNPVRSVQFSPDGTQLLTAHESAGIQLWNLDVNDLMNRGCDRLHHYLHTTPDLTATSPTICP